ncbi:C2HC5-type-containing protein [Hexamita inflata]|uniref:C2HC5-type-containing protein n=2 Tax=Hexamita inflata TaxID=28002 RepID=A0AA86T954_9EUKA|nr:C2HC5-type-containing protein [Hexamita inflata]
MRRQYCECHGTEHPLIERDGYAMMCENCGNIYCELQGTGNCLFCGANDGQLMEKPYTQNGALKVQDFLETTSNLFKEAKQNKYIKITEDIKAGNQIDTGAISFQSLIYQNLEEVIDPDEAVADDQLVYID